MELKVTIDTIRRNVGDYQEPRKFEEISYKDAIHFALSKLSFDFGTSYPTSASVPIEREFLLLKLATIQMCYVRAAAILDDDDTTRKESGGVTNLTVPDLSVSESDEGNSDSAETWLDLASKLQLEYDGELEHGGEAVVEVQVGFLNAHSRKTGGLANRRLDRGLPATVLGAVVTANSVAFTWSIVYHPEFLAYELVRSQDNFVTEKQAMYRGDNQIATYTDEELGSGVYQYKLNVINPNSIKTPSNIIEVTIS